MRNDPPTAREVSQPDLSPALFRPGQDLANDDYGVAARESSVNRTMSVDRADASQSHDNRRELEDENLRPSSSSVQLADVSPVVHALHDVRVDQMAEEEAAASRRATVTPLNLAVAIDITAGENAADQSDENTTGPEWEVPPPPADDPPSDGDGEGKSSDEIRVTFAPPHRAAAAASASASASASSRKSVPNTDRNTEVGANASRGGKRFSHGGKTPASARPPPSAQPPSAPRGRGRNSRGGK